jgi:DNA polymerase III delta subunit
MLYSLVGHFRRLLHARAVIDKKGSLQDLQSRLSDHPFVVEKAFRQANAYSSAELERAFRNLLRIEEQVKLGELDVRIGLEGFILEQALSAV